MKVSVVTRHIFDSQLDQFWKKRLGRLFSPEEPYFWRLKISWEEYRKLEDLIKLCKEKDENELEVIKKHPLEVACYIAEYYKRTYVGDDSPSLVLELPTRNLQVLWDCLFRKGVPKKYLHIDPKTNRTQWGHSIYCLGGFAIRFETRRNNHFINWLCDSYRKLQENDDFDFESDVVEHLGATANYMRESIVNHESLYDCALSILEDDDFPIAESDYSDENNPEREVFVRFKQLFEEEKARKLKKFQISWVAYWHPELNLPFKLDLLVKLQKNRSYNQYIAYETLRNAPYRINNPEEYQSISFYYRLTSETGEVMESEGQPLLEFFNAGKDAGFLSNGATTEVRIPDVPLKRYEKFEIFMIIQEEERIIHSEKLHNGKGDYYILHRTNSFYGNEWSSRNNAQCNATAILFDKNITELLNVKEENFNVITNNVLNSNWRWYFIADELTVEDNHTSKTFYNSTGHYQWHFKQDFLCPVIQYTKQGKIKHYWKDESEELFEEELPVVFGLNWITLRVFREENDNDFEDIDLLKSRLTDDDDNLLDKEAYHGIANIHQSFRGKDIVLHCYYIPYSGEEFATPPIWRYCNDEQIKWNFPLLDNLLVPKTIQLDTKNWTMDDVYVSNNCIKDNYPLTVDDKPYDTIPFILGNEKDYLVMPIYRAKIKCELWKKDSNGIFKLVNCKIGPYAYTLFKNYAHLFRFRIINQKGIDYSSVLQFPQILRDVSIRQIDDVKNYDRSETRTFKIGNESVDCYSFYYWENVKDINTVSAWTIKSKEPGKITIKHFRNLLSHPRGIIFQGIENNNVPTNHFGPFVFQDMSSVSALNCFKVAKKYQASYLSFQPLKEIACDPKLIVNQLFVPLLEEHNRVLPNDIIDELYRFALEFDFDWILLPFDVWDMQYKEQIEELFLSSPFLTSLSKRKALRDFLNNGYWTSKLNARSKGLAYLLVSYIYGKKNLFSLCDDKRRKTLIEFHSCDTIFTDMYNKLN